MSQALYSPSELHTIINNENFIIVAVLSADDFNAGHISGSRWLDPSELTLNEKPALGLLPSTRQLQTSLERLGINQNKTIIAYDNAGGSAAGRFIWTLALFGFHNTALLNGGHNAWKSAELPLTQDTQNIAASQLKLTLNTEFLASKDDVLASLDNSNCQIWDARSEDEYTGEKVLAARGGHIPGAISLNWTRLLTSDTSLKSIDAIKAELISAGIDSKKILITHCQTHRRSGLTWFVGYKLLGLNIKAYAGSWSEWGNDITLPVES